MEMIKPAQLYLCMLICPEAALVAETERPR